MRRRAPSTSWGLAHTGGPRQATIAMYDCRALLSHPTWQGQGQAASTATGACVGGRALSLGGTVTPGCRLSRPGRPVASARSPTGVTAVHVRSRRRSADRPRSAPAPASPTREQYDRSRLSSLAERSASACAPGTCLCYNPRIHVSARSAGARVALARVFKQVQALQRGRLV